MSQSPASPESLLERARAGDDQARGRLLEAYRNYLRVVARSLIEGTLRVRIEPSDLVQETFLKAHRQFDGFAGKTEAELVAWLRQILVRSVADQVKHSRRLARDHGRSQSLEAALERSSTDLERALASPASSPSAAAERRERAVLLADALETLPDAYREVFILRSIEHVPVEKIALRMGRSVNAVHKLWARAMAALKQALEEHHDPS